MFKKVEKGLLVNIKIVPNASKNEVILDEKFIRVRVTAQPIENKANKALIEVLSKYFKVPKSKIEIVRGETSKDKVLLFKIDEQKIEEVQARLLRIM